MVCDVTVQIDIPASAEQVWSVLARLDRYPDWNPHIVAWKGEIERGARVRETLRTTTGRELTFRPILTRIEPERELAQRGRTAILGIFTAMHRFVIDLSMTGVSDHRCN